jgi:hypothetical protein
LACVCASWLCSASTSWWISDSCFCRAHWLRLRLDSSEAVLQQAGASRYNHVPSWRHWASGNEHQCNSGSLRRPETPPGWYGCLWCCLGGTDTHGVALQCVHTRHATYRTCMPDCLFSTKSTCNCVKLLAFSPHIP